MDNCAFWNAINILITKPHVINKRLWGYNKLIECKCKPLQQYWEEKLSVFKMSNGKVDTILEELTNKVPILLDEVESAEIELILVQLLPKIYSESRAYQLICLKKLKNSVTFYDVSPEDYNQNLCPNFPYTFSILENKINVKVHNNGKYELFMSYGCIKNTEILSLNIFSIRIPYILNLLCLNELIIIYLYMQLFLFSYCN